MKTFVSCGFLLQSQDKYLLCHPSNLRVGSSVGDKKWGLPKGKQDPGETLLSCAIRETKEETTIDLLDDNISKNLLITSSPIYSTEYLTTFKGEQIVKQLRIFHAYENVGDLQKLPLNCPTLVENTNIPEIDDFRWLTRTEAMKICMHSIRDLFENLESYVIFGKN